MTPEERLDGAPERAGPLPVDDAQLEHARRAAGVDPLRDELAHVRRTEGVQVEDAVERERHRLAGEVVALGRIVVSARHRGRRQ